MILVRGDYKTPDEALFNRIRKVYAAYWKPETGYGDMRLPFNYVLYLARKPQTADRLFLRRPIIDLELYGGMNMKRIGLILLCGLLVVAFWGCAKETAVKNTIEGNMKTYYEMTDGTWKCDGRVYQYRLEISGRMPNAAVDTSFVYLSNIEEITFEQAYLAAGVSSNSNAYFSPEKAVLVEMNLIDF